MNMKEYVPAACRTESKELLINKQLTSRDFRILHGSMGIVTEAGELMDALKKHIYYGKELDLVNIKEEMGDIMWYMAILCDELGTSFDELTTINIDKLKARYPEKFTSEKALNRDLSKEREILES